MARPHSEVVSTCCQNVAPIRVEPTAASFRIALMFGARLLVLALGHMLSNMLRTPPAIAVDAISTDIAVSPERLVCITAAYHFAFSHFKNDNGVGRDHVMPLPNFCT